MGTAPVLINMAIAQQECGAGQSWSDVDPDVYCSDAPCDDIYTASESGYGSSAIDFYHQGTYPITYECSDNDANEAEGTITVDVVDTLVPTIVCPDDVQIDMDQMGGVSGHSWTATCTDQCHDALTQHDDGDAQASSHVDHIGTYTVTFECEDSASHFVTCTHDVVVVDPHGPECHITQEHYTVEACTGSWTSAGYSFTDNYDQDINSKYVRYCGTSGCPEDNLSNPGDYSVWYVATDQSENQNEVDGCQEWITVVDTTAPVASAAADVTIEASSLESNDYDISADRTDTCGVSGVELTGFTADAYSYQRASEASYYCGGSSRDADSAASAFLYGQNQAELDEQCGCYTATFTCTDVNGNTDTDSQSVCVQDTTPPVIEIEEGYYNFFAQAAGSKAGAAGFVAAGALVGALVVNVVSKKSSAGYEAL